ncbi:hypothetical protein ALC62_02486 [Cyphomyrmex costatus]|uniref:SAP domain-containing protein n=1 Tax=Cyphomyrmex costatus TaxID=456900 RepID=A0A151INB4_9HYME|nr:hypothetical protein ALC62_02486 [Cyphomyrmex costatus]
MSITVKAPSEYLINELKAALRERNLHVTGSKAELIERLTKHNPNIWTRPLMATTGADEEYHDAAQEDEEMASDGARSGEVEDVSTLLKDKEWELLRRERDLLARELAFERHRNEALSNTSMSTPTAPFEERYGVSGHVNIRAISDLLSEFNGVECNYQNWVRELRLLGTTYNLTDNDLKILIIRRLKGRALKWFHSKPEHLEIRVDELLEQMWLTFDHLIV